MDALEYLFNEYATDEFKAAFAQAVCFCSLSDWSVCGLSEIPVINSSTISAAEAKDEVQNLKQMSANGQDVM